MENIIFFFTFLKILFQDEYVSNLFIFLAGAIVGKFLELFVYKILNRPKLKVDIDGHKFFSNTETNGFEFELPINISNTGGEAFSVYEINSKYFYFSNNLNFTRFSFLKKALFVLKKKKVNGSRQRKESILLNPGENKHYVVSHQFKSFPTSIPRNVEWIIVEVILRTVKLGDIKRSFTLRKSTRSYE